MAQRKSAKKAQRKTGPSGLTLDQAAEFVRLGAERTSMEDIARVVLNSEAIRREVSGRAFQKVRPAARRMLGLVEGAHSGVVTNVPLRALATMAFALDYVINPVDIIPDFLPHLGHLDDVRVIEAAALLVKKELAKLASGSKRR
jgi:uncharacterized membrane protein YkvA (DUF1232 family)